MKALTRVGPSQDDSATWLLSGHLECLCVGSRCDLVSSQHGSPQNIPASGLETAYLALVTQLWKSHSMTSLPSPGLSSLKPAQIQVSWQGDSVPSVDGWGHILEKHEG